MRRSAAAILIVQLIAQLLGGCSFALVSGPPANHRQLPVVECTTSRLGPGLDTAWTILQLLNFGVAAAQSDQRWDEQFDGEPPFSRSVALGVYGSLAALGAAGMYYGFTRTAECRRAKNEWMLRGGFGGPQPGVGTWPPPPASPPG